MIAHAHALAAAVLCALAGGLGAGASLHCAMRREISPCTCRREDADTGAILVTCQRINTFEEIARALTNKFSPMTKIRLDISYSQLSDFSAHSIRDLGLSITRLKLNNDNLSDLSESAFTKLDLVDLFSISDNSLAEMPSRVLRHLPRLNTLDLCRNKITKLSEEDFREIQQLKHLLVAGNQISKIEKQALPIGLKNIHLGFNNLNTLNGALRDLDSLEWIFINANNLKSIDNELPVVIKQIKESRVTTKKKSMDDYWLSKYDIMETVEDEYLIFKKKTPYELKAKKLNLIHAAQNNLENLPKDLRLIPSLRSLYFYDNNIKSLEGSLQKSKQLSSLSLSFNKIESLSEDEFTETENLADLDIAYNQLRSLNGSLRSLRALRYLNLTHNLFTEFSLKEIKGLKRLSVIDLSHNKISHLTGNTENLVDAETSVLELRLDHNYLHHIGGALMGLHGLLRLNVSHNFIQKISPDELIGLDDLRMLDISYNQITTLEETSKTFLPALEELVAHHNNITTLDKDFHGLPSLCLADLSQNQIMSINYDLVSKTRCTINGVPSILKIYLQDNPVLCDERLYELVTVLEKLNARASGTSACVPTATEAPLLIRALNDVVPAEDTAPLIVVTHLLPYEGDNSPGPRIVGHMLPDREGGLPVVVEPPITLPPPSTRVVVKWPDEARRQPPHPVSDQLRLRSINGSSQ